MIQTKYHGEIEIDEKDIIHFEKGIPGFLEEKEYVIMPLSDDQNFSILQSIMTPHIAFVIASPFHFFRDYEFELEDSAVGEMDIKSEIDLIVFSILSIKKDLKKTTANLLAPIIINTANQKAKQVILNNSAYHTKHPIFQKG